MSNDTLRRARTRARLGLVVGVSLLFAGAPARADSYAFGFSKASADSNLILQTGSGSITINDAGFQGWVSDAADDLAGPGGNTNYLAGNLGSSHYNDFFVFGISGITSSVTAATFTVDAATISDVLTFRLGDATAYASELYDASSPNIGLFNDLSSGTEFGSYTLTASESGTLLTFTLNSAGVAALNAAISGGASEFALGGTVLGSAVPEPTSWMLTIAGVGLIGGALRRKSRSVHELRQAMA